MLTFGTPGYLKSENIRFRQHSLKYESGFLTNHSNDKLNYNEQNISFSNFSLKIPSGYIYYDQITGIVGKNGIGKSTFLNQFNNQNFFDQQNIKISFKQQYIQNNTECIICKR